MPCRKEAISRPPLGFIVEGAGEVACYPSLVSRSLACSYLHCPVLNAGGYGNIIGKVAEQLTDLVMQWQPYTVVITIDAREPVRDGVVANCAELRCLLLEEVLEWERRAPADGRLECVPERVDVVIQVPKFERWLVADVQSIIGAGYALFDGELPDIGSDESLTDPATLLNRVLAPGYSTKNPLRAKEIVSVLDIGVARTRSRSFDKFVRDVQRNYNSWLGAISEP